MTVSLTATATTRVTCSCPAGADCSVACIPNDQLPSAADSACVAVKKSESGEKTTPGTAPL